ncbi:hypothetical protein Asp14428_48900 [Actinoplanes sp. NBRC 14428]|nr:hypothetical protein Asp14428_48900 [Actinoplanes sp. NBRC 14428]
MPEWDSRECPGPSSEALLSRPSTGRVLAAGALALAVSAPVLEPVSPAEASTSPVIAAAEAAAPILEARTADRVASRAAVRRSPTRVATAASLAVRRAEESRHDEEARIIAERMAAAERSLAAERAAAAQRRAATVRAAQVRARQVRARQVRVREARARQVAPRIVRRVPARMESVLAFARSQVGKRYARGGEGPSSFDCSGFTKRAYALIGLRLPHSSGGQAARARVVSRAAARPGDLVVGSGHVGIYMGGGMMIDAGNPRTGVVYRRMYAGLHIERF